VTSLTISRASEEFIRALVDREGLPSRVVREHLMEHTPDEPYDAIVNLGVTEHLPTIRGTLKKYQSLLKPGAASTWTPAPRAASTATPPFWSAASFRATAR
jgi:cyclopropane-fatty-acyl-phospholipid synthase